MTKQGRLTSVEKYAIQHLRNEQKTIEEICDEIGRPIHVVKKYVDGELAKIQETVAKVQAQQATSPVSPLPKTKDLFIRSTKSGNKESGVTIMSEQASQRSDESKSNRKFVNRHSHKNIYRISDQKILENGENI